MTDQELVQRSQKGDLEAFNHLVSRWEEPIYRFLRKSVGDRDEARDLCQETLVKAYLHIRGLRDGARFKTWLYRIAWNQCISRFRRQRVRGEVHGVAELIETAVDPAARGPADLGQIVAERDLSLALRQAMDDLPEEQRTAILLREFQGLTSEEIGEVTGVSAGTVRTRIYYGLRTLRRTLRQRGLAGLEETV